MQTLFTKDCSYKSKEEIYRLNGGHMNDWNQDDIFYALTNYEALHDILPNFEVHNLAVTIMNRGIKTMQDLNALSISDLNNMQQPILKLNSILFCIKSLCAPIYTKPQIVDIIKKQVPSMEITSFGQNEIIFVIRHYIDFAFMTFKQKELLINMFMRNNILTGRQLHDLDDQRLKEMGICFTNNVMDGIKSFFC